MGNINATGRIFLLAIALALPTLARAGDGSSRLGDDASTKKRPAEIKVIVTLDKRAFHVGERIVGTIRFENISTKRIELFYGGIDGPGVGQHQIATRVVVGPDGTTRFVCKHRSARAGGKTDLYPIELDSNEEEFEIGSVEDIADVVSETAKLASGKSVVFKIDLTAYLTPYLRDEDKSDSVRTGTYEVQIEYESSGDLYWAGIASANKVQFKLLPAKTEMSRLKAPKE